MSNSPTKYINSPDFLVVIIITIIIIIIIIIINICYHNFTGYLQLYTRNETYFWSM